MNGAVVPEYLYNMYRERYVHSFWKTASRSRYRVFA
jgi:hypothetical protein